MAAAMDVMSGDAAPDRLTDRSVLTLILRLVLDRDGHVLTGQIGGNTGDHWVSFCGLAGQRQALVDSLARREKEPGT